MVFVEKLEKHDFVKKKVSYSLILGWGLRYCISNNLLSDTDTTKHGPTEGFNSTQYTIENRISRHKNKSIKVPKLKDKIITERK